MRYKQYRKLLEEITKNGGKTICDNHYVPIFSEEPPQTLLELFNILSQNPSRINKNIEK